MTSYSSSQRFIRKLVQWSYFVFFFFLFFQQRSASFFFFFFALRSRHRKWRSRSSNLSEYFFFLNSFHAFLEINYERPFLRFFFLFATRFSLHRNRTKTENRIFRISRSRNFSLFIQVSGQCLNFASFLRYINIYKRKFRVKNCAKWIEKCEECSYICDIINELLQMNFEN